MSIVESTFSGNDGYRVGYIGSPVNPDNAMARWQKGNCPLAALKTQPRPESAPEVLVYVEPGAGVPFLYGFASTETGTFPAGTQVTVTDPNGNTLQAGDGDGSIVYFVGNSLQCFIIANPTPGTWKLVANIPPADDSDVYVFISTIPSGDDPYQTMVTAIEQQLDKEAIDAAQDDDSVACWACKIACWGLAVLIAMIAAAGAFTIGLPVSLPAVAAVALFFGFSVAVMTGILLAAIAAIGTAVTIIALNFCAWINACESGLTASIGTPKNNTSATGTFKIAANTTGADSVCFSLDSAVLDTVTQGPPFKYFCDGTQFPNGPHTISALAISGMTTALAVPVTVTFKN